MQYPLNNVINCFASFPFNNVEGFFRPVKIKFIFGEVSYIGTGPDFDQVNNIKNILSAFPKRNPALIKFKVKVAFWQ